MDNESLQIYIDKLLNLIKEYVSKILLLETRAEMLLKKKKEVDEELEDLRSEILIYKNTIHDYEKRFGKIKIVEEESSSSFNSD